MTLSSAPEDRRFRALVSLDGLSVGDALGERFFGPHDDAVARIRSRTLPPSPWRATDDTEMAIAITEMLITRGQVDCEELAHAFVRRFVADPDRGYGGGAVSILQQIRRGARWSEVAAGAFDGRGSCGNGGAMRVAPLGAFFADDLHLVVEQADASARVTHAHPDGRAGAIAVAIASAVAWQESSGSLVDTALSYCPAGATRDGLERARDLPFSTSIEHAVRELGSGSRVISSDTVPFAIWCAERHRTNYEDAFWNTVAGLGDRDTTCAIVGGIVAAQSLPPRSWRTKREPLRFESPHRVLPRTSIDKLIDRVEAWFWNLRGRGS